MKFKKQCHNSSITAIPKRNLDHILHYLITQQMSSKQTDIPLPDFPNGRHKYFRFKYYNSFQVVIRLKGTALCLLKTKYAVKPKNPV
jgi:hypothetical protein